MKTVIIIGSLTKHKNYQTALEKASCNAVILPDTSALKEAPGAFDGLLLPGGGDVPATLSGYAPYGKFPPDFPLMPRRSDSASRSDTSSRHAAFSECRPQNFPAALSSDISLDIEQLLALHLFYRQNKPVFGICKGMQLINLYFHGTIREVSEKKLHQHPKKDVFHASGNLPNSFLYALFGSDMSVNSNHHQCVDRIGQNLQIIQYAPDQTPEALCHLTAPIMGTQWHPERMPDMPKNALLLFRYFVSLL